MQPLRLLRTTKTSSLEPEVSEFLDSALRLYVVLLSHGFSWFAAISDVQFGCIPVAGARARQILSLA